MRGTGRGGRVVGRLRVGERRGGGDVGRGRVGERRGGGDVERGRVGARVIVAHPVEVIHNTFSSV